MNSKSSTLWLIMIHAWASIWFYNYFYVSFLFFVSAYIQNFRSYNARFNFDLILKQERLQFFTYKVFHVITCIEHLRMFWWRFNKDFALQVRQALIGLSSRKSAPAHFGHLEVDCLQIEKTLKESATKNASYMNFINSLASYLQK